MGNCCGCGSRKNDDKKKQDKPKDEKKSGCKK